MNPIDWLLISVIALIFGKALHVTVENFRSENPCSACNGNCPNCKKRLEMKKV